MSLDLLKIKIKSLRHLHVIKSDNVVSIYVNSTNKNINDLRERHLTNLLCVEFFGLDY